MSYYTTIMRDAPSAYYRLGESSGTTANDSTGTYAGTLNGTITKGVSGAITGDPNTAMALDGSTGYIGIPIGLDLSGATSFSLEAWVKLPVASSGASYRLLANAHTDSDNTGYQLAIGSSSFFNFKTSLGYCYQAFSVTWNTNTWIYIAAIYDGTAGYVYINGTNNVTSSSVYGTLVASTYPTNVGRNPAYAGDYVPGSVDEVAIYKNKALTSDQVRNHYQSGLVPSSTRSHTFARIV